MSPKNPEPLKTGIIGVGLLGGSHARTAAGNANVTLKAVADTRAAIGRGIANETGAVWYADYNEMLSKEDLDLVIVATPDPLHKDPIVATARAGVARIITEKPLATERTDALRMRDAVTKAGADLYILFPNRFSPLDRAVSYAMKNKLIGAPVYGDVRLDDNISVPTQMWGNRSKTWAGGSSTAHFLFSHVVDLLRWYFRPADVVEVRAISQNRVLKYTPDLYDAHLTFDTGLVVRIKAEWIRRMDALVEFELGFSGQKGTVYYRKTSAFRAKPGLRFDLDNATPASLTKHQKVLSSQGIRSRVVSDTTARSPHVLEFFAEENGSDSALGHYFETLRNGRKSPKIDGFGPLPGLQDALRQVDIVTALVKSANQGKSIKVPSSV
jgi:predicted dehydrogenase